jgi:hydrogenase nickel incorporation protein HypA/HybF
MHEMSLARSIVDLIEEQRQRAGFARVRRIRIAIGQLATVDARALEFGFDVVARGSAAEGAALAIERPAGRAYCTDCAETVEIASRADPCPLCAGHRWVVVAGEELRVVDLEVD